MSKLTVLWVGLLAWSFSSMFTASAESSLQMQIDEAPENATIRLGDQTYEGNLLITKSLTLKGTPNTKIRGDGTGNVIQIDAPNVHLDTIKIEHGSKSMDSEQEYAAVKVNSDHNVIENLQITDSYHGVFLKNAEENIIRNVRVKGLVGRQGGREIAHQGNGVQLIHSHRNLIENCFVDGARDGIYVFYSDQNNLKKNRVQNTRYGVHYMYAHDNRFVDNEFTMNEGGAAIMISSGTELIGNKFYFHNSSQAFGVLMQSVQETTILNNKFYRNLRGIYIDDARDGLIKGNQFSNNQIGVEIWSSANNQQFTENHFFHNTAPVIRMGSGKSNQWSKENKGNDWGAEFPLLDVDQNGIGDDPVRYTSSLYKLIQENDLVYLFLNSPAIQIYEKMNELLHQQEEMFEDPFPLINKVQKPSIGLFWVMVSSLMIAAMWYYRKRRKKA